MSVQFRGTSKNQDGRFGDKMTKLRSTLNFSRVLKKKIDFSKIKLEILKEWITNRAIESLGCEDELVINYIFCMLESKNPNPKDMQIYLTGFMEDDARFFMKDLWLFLNEAQKSPNGIPQRLIDEEKEKILKENEEKEKISEKIKERLLPPEPSENSDRHATGRKRKRFEYDSNEEESIQKKRKLN